MRNGRESQLIEQIAMRTTGPDPATIADTIEHVRREAMASAGVVDLCPPVVPGDIVRVSDGRPVGLAPSAVRYTTTHVICVVRSNSSSGRPSRP